MGFHLSLRPPDDKHPFGHGKIESLAGIFSGTALLLAAFGIAVQSVREILTPHHSPEWFTLPVLVGVVITKEILSRKISSFATGLDSRALEGDAWHHRSDALTSGAAAIGITLALVGGPAWAVADDWAALVACGIIVANGIRILRRSLHDTLDGRVDTAIAEALHAKAMEVEGVAHTEKCMVRKSGMQYFAELHVQVDGEMSVLSGHRIGHEVKAVLLEAFPELLDVVIHLEPSPRAGGS
jgi:cation diffusion facilitator family transporter